MLKTIKNKLKWLVKRHPLLYYVRFALFCKNYKGNLDELPTFNDLNKKEDIDALFYEVNEQIPLTPEMDDFDKALVIAIYLRKKIKGGTGLGFSSNKTLQLMLEGKGGVCSDHSQIYNIFCLINDIKVREWGAVEKFYNPQYGHTFNEIYSPALKKWILMDVGKNLYFKSSKDGAPLPVIELFTSLREGKPLIYHHFSDHICIDMYKIDKTYAKETIPFLITNYNNKVYDAYLNKYQDRMPSFMINGTMLLAGKNYHFLFVIDNYKNKLLHL